MSLLFKRALVNAIFIGFLFSAPVNPVFAGQHSGLHTVINFQKVSQRQAASIARKRHGGKVLDVKTVRSDSGIVYRVKLLLDSGRVKVVTVNGG